MEVVIPTNKKVVSNLDGSSFGNQHKIREVTKTLRNDWPLLKAILAEDAETVKTICRNLGKAAQTSFSGIERNTEAEKLPGKCSTWPSSVSVLKYLADELCKSVAIWINSCYSGAFLE